MVVAGVMVEWENVAGGREVDREVQKGKGADLIKAWYSTGRI